MAPSKMIHLNQIFVQKKKLRKEKRSAQFDTNSWPTGEKQGQGQRRGECLRERSAGGSGPALQAEFRERIQNANQEPGRGPFLQPGHTMAGRGRCSAPTPGLEQRMTSQLTH